MCNFERTLNIHPLFVVSVAVLIVDFHKSRLCNDFISDKIIRGRGDIRYDVTTHDVLKTM